MLALTAVLLPRQPLDHTGGVHVVFTHRPRPSSIPCYNVQTHTHTLTTFHVLSIADMLQAGFGPETIA